MKALVKALEWVMKKSGEKHNITELISSQQQRGPSMETWIKGSVQWLFTFLSLFLRHRVAKAFITSAATAPFSPAYGEEWMSIKKEEAVIKYRRFGTISGWRPHPVAPTPGPGTPASSQAGSVLLCVANLFHTHLQQQTAPHHFSMCYLYLNVLMGRQQTCCGRLCRLPEAKPFLINSFLIKDIHFTITLRESWSEELKQCQIK